MSPLDLLLLLDTVRLRPLRESDLAALHALLSEEPVRRAFGHQGAPSYEALEADLPAMIAG